ncbi:MAG: cytochrome c peroxidase [Maribacter sp.]|jgi:cytochrome c peroxidase
MIIVHIINSLLHSIIIFMKKINNIFLIPILLIFCLTACQEDVPQDNMFEEEMDVELKSLIEAKGGLEYFILPNSNDYDNIPQDPNNPISSQRITLGKKLFYETGLARNPAMSESMETYSCATCHIPGANFQAGIRQGIGDGGMGIGVAGEGRFPNPNYDETLLDIPPIRVPNNVNTAYIVNAAWDGKLGATGANIGTEDLWIEEDVFLSTNNLGYTGIETQAIAGLEFHRMIVEESLVENSYYKDLFDFSFPGFPENERYTFETAGLAIAAFERSMLTNQAPFQDWLKGDSEALSMNQKQGAALFFDKANCITCHKSPSLNTNEFYAVGMGNLEGEGVLNIFENFNEINKGRGNYTGNPADDYKFKTPQLYNLRNTNFLGHGATFSGLREVVEYKNEAIKQNADVLDSQLSEYFIPLDLTSQEIDQLVDFLKNGLYDPNMHRYVTETVASGNCFPNNDSQSQEDMGCDQ